MFKLSLTFPKGHAVVRSIVVRSIVLVVTLALVGCESEPPPDVDSLLLEAQESIDIRRVDLAMGLLKSAVEAEPANAQARWMMGKIFFDIGEWSSALKELRRATDLGISEHSTLPLIAQALLATGNFEELEAMKAPASMPPPQRAEMLAIRAVGRLAQGDRKGSSALLREASQIDPTSPAAKTGLAQWHLRYGMRDRGFELIRSVIDSHPAYAPAWRLFGRLAQANGQLDLANEALTKAIDLTLRDWETRERRVGILIQLGRYEAARSDIERLRTIRANSPSLNFLDGWLHLVTDDFAGARAAFETTLRYDRNHLRAMFYLGAIHLRDGNLDLARDLLRRVVEETPDYMEAKVLYATALLRADDAEQALSVLESVRDRLAGDAEALGLLAQLYLRTGDPASAADLLQKLVVLRPDSPDFRLQWGNALIDSGAADSGVARLRDAARRFPSRDDIEQQLIRRLVGLGRYDTALEDATDYNRRHASSVDGMNLLGAVYLARGDRAEARSAYSSARKLQPDDPVSGRALAAMSAQDGDHDSARIELEQVLEGNPDDLETLLQLAILEFQRGADEAARSTLRRARRIHPDALRPRLMLAEDALRSGDPEAAVAHLSVVDVANEEPPVLLLLGQAQMRLGRMRDARRTLGRLAAERPDDPRVHWLLAKAVEQLGDDLEAERLLARVVYLAPDWVDAHMSLARLALANQHLGEAERSLDVVKKARPDDEDVVLLEVSLLSRRGRAEEALTMLDAHFKNAPTALSAVSLAEQYWALDRRPEAVATLERWLDDHPQDSAVRLALAHYLRLLGRQIESIALYEKVLAQTPSEPLALVNLAYLLLERDASRALELARRASRLAPRSPVVQDILALAHMGVGDLDTALDLSDRAAARTRNPVIEYHRATILAAAGRNDEAEALLDFVLAVDKKFRDRAAAERLLELVRERLEKDGKVREG